MLGFSLPGGPPIRVVYRADQDADEVFELYRHDARSGEVTKANLPLPVGGDVEFFLTDPNGKFVVYWADQDTDEVHELYRHDLRSGEITKINPPLTAGGNVETFLIDPKGQSVFYTADRTRRGPQTLSLDVAAPARSRSSIDGWWRAGGSKSFGVAPR